MQTQLISIRMPKQLVTQLTRVVAKEGYSSVQEIIKESVRAYLAEKKLAWARKELQTVFGSQKLKRPLTKKVKDEIIAEYEKRFQ